MMKDRTDVHKALVLHYRAQTVFNYTVAKDPKQQKLKNNKGLVQAPRL